MKHSEKQFLLDVAKLAAARSTGVRLKVGAVVSDSIGNMIASGYNGSIVGGDNCLEFKEYQPSGLSTIMLPEYPLRDLNGANYKLVTKPDVIHAEMNLIAHAARRGISIAGGTVFVTTSPCKHCTAMMIQAGIVEVIFLDEYRLHHETVLEYGHRIKLTHWEQ